MKEESPHMSKGFRAGLCIPSTCSAQEKQSIADGSKLSMNHFNERQIQLFSKF
jgi:hypothetical protein